MKACRCRKRSKRRLSAVASIVWVAGSFWIAQPAQAAGVYRVASDSVTLELVRMPEKYQDGPWILELFAASADSSFWCGPIKPNIHSWLSLSVICRDTTAFRIEYSTDAADEFATLAFEGVVPGFWRVGVYPARRPGTGLVSLRFIHSGRVVHECKVALP